MAKADAGGGKLSVRWWAVLHRDGLVIALLVARPLRRRNFVALELGRHLVRAGGGKGRPGLRVVAVGGGWAAERGDARPPGQGTHPGGVRAVNPPLFRDAAATSLALEDPARVRIAAQVLGHGSFGTTERHYNLARGEAPELET